MAAPYSAFITHYTSTSRGILVVNIGQLTKESGKRLGFGFSIGPYAAFDSQIAITVQVSIHNAVPASNRLRNSMLE